MAYKITGAIVRNSNLRTNSTHETNTNIGINISLHQHNGNLEIVKNSNYIRYFSVFINNLDYFVASAIFENARRTLRFLTSKPKDIKLTPNKYCYYFSSSPLAAKLREAGYRLICNKTSLSKSNNPDLFVQDVIKCIDEIVVLLNEHIKYLKPEELTYANQIIQQFGRVRETFDKNAVLFGRLFLNITNPSPVTSSDETTV